ncbi:MAG: hypothetical protein FJ297_17725 [Planctomycetes bacterium]|nr:hypothetical protein [Planctomycetota bacterium]
MSGPAFRFVHSGDFRLHETISGLTEIPEGLRDALLDGPFASARRVVDVAIEEEAAFVVLSGDLLNPLETSPRGLAFLIEQFERLAERRIAVYWAGGRADPPDRWPDAIGLPDNITYFSRTRLEEVAHYVSDHHSATLLGRSSGGRARIDLTEFSRDTNDEFCIAVFNGDVDADSLAGTTIHYWALGGRPNRRTLIEQPRRIVHYCGTPQGRSPKDLDAHGCTLVQVDTQRQVHAKAIATDAVRFRVEPIFVPDRSSRSEVSRILRERARQIAGESGERTVLVQWDVETGCRTAADLRHGPLAQEVMRDVQPSGGAHAVWTIGIEPRIQGELPAHWSEEDTILGDYLRAIREYGEDSQPLMLGEFLGSREPDGMLRDLLQIAESSERREFLREAALLGADLLRGDA